VVSTPSAIQAIFKDSDQHSKAENMGSGYLMSEMLGHCVGFLSGAAWRSLRKQMDPPFMHSGASSLVPRMIEMTEHHLDAVFASGSSKAEHLDPVADLIMLPFFMIATVFYGDLTSDQVNWLEEWTPKREKLFGHALGGGLPRFRFSRYLPTEANRSLPEWNDAWKSFNVEAYRILGSKESDAFFAKIWKEACNRGGVTQEQVRSPMSSQMRQSSC
jgi:cytochrome P450